MSALAVAPEAPSLFDDARSQRDEATSLFDDARSLRDDVPSLIGSPTGEATLDGQATLDDLLTGAWDGLAAHRTIACLMCGEPMAPAYGAHALPIGGKCGGCGTRLS